MIDQAEITRESPEEDAIRDAGVIRDLKEATQKVVDLTRNLDVVTRNFKTDPEAALADLIFNGNRELQQARKAVCALAMIAVARGLFDDCAAFIERTPARAS